MPDTQPQDSSAPTPDIGSIIGGTDKGTVADLVKMQGARTAEDFSITRKADAQLDRDQARTEAAYKAEGVGHDELKPWDANKEHKKFEHDPIEGFGSVGGLFAMVASAFTKAPMENAINGMAGAINSIKAGDEAAYERAHTSWKDNTKLAIDRWKMQHDLYQDALSLMDHNSGVATAKLRNAATRFGDSQTLMLAEHGMVKELYELQSARAKAAEQMESSLQSVTLGAVQREAVKATVKGMEKTGDPMVDAIQMTAAIQRIYDPGKTHSSAEQAAVADFTLKHMNDPDFADKLAEMHQKFSPKAPNIQGYQEAREAAAAANGGVIPPEEDAKLLQQFGLSARPTGAGTGAGKTLTNDRTINADAEEHKQRQKKEHPDWDEAKLDADRDAYVKSRKIATTAPSGNRQDDLQGKIDQIDNIIHGSEKNLDFLRTFKGGAGLMGKIMRGEEIAENIVGAGTQTDRVAFRRRVHELQEMVPRIITDSNGRPLKAAQDKVDDFVAGLNAGDTGPNTIRAYEDLITEMQKRQGDYRKRKAGSEAPAPGAADKKPDADWLNAYPVKGGTEKRSDAGGSSRVAAGDPSDPNFWLEASS